MKMLVKTLGGSTAYGLNTPESDLDYRGVFVNTDPAKILGLEKLEHVQKQETDDVVYYEVRKFFELLKNGNTGALEILFTEEQIERTDIFDEIRAERLNFIDTERLYKCLLGYMQSERRVANGERVGVLGSKRKAQLDKYGFSPKNATQLLRLSFCGVTLFIKGHFPINIKLEDDDMWKLLFSVKTTPEKYTKTQINELFDTAGAQLEEAYRNRTIRSEFDSTLANDILRRTYLPFLV